MVTSVLRAIQSRDLGIMENTERMRVSRSFIISEISTDPSSRSGICSNEIRATAMSKSTISFYYTKDRNLSFSYLIFLILFATSIMISINSSLVCTTE